jgi:hypothetical protein
VQNQVHHHPSASLLCSSHQIDKKDLWHLLKLEPTNETAQEELQQVRAMIKDAERVKVGRVCCLAAG